MGIGYFRADKNYWLGALLGFAWVCVLACLLSLFQEKPWQEQTSWRTLKWRVTAFQVLDYACRVMSWFVGMDAGRAFGKGSSQWLPPLVVVGATILILYFVTEPLLKGSKCPRCHEKFFRKTGAQSNFLLFGLEKWPNTNCQKCDFALWQPLAENASKPASR